MARYVREGRMVWPLTWIVVAGTAPGVVAGGMIRLTYLPDPHGFKAFVGAVLLYVGIRMVADIQRSWRGRGKSAAATGSAAVGTIRVKEWTLRRLAYEFQGETHACSVPGIFLLSLAVGLVGGIYGIGGGAIIAPFFVAIYRLPVHTVAGATLMGTFVTSIVGVAFYQIVAPWYAGQTVAPDWLLGGLFGLGGLAGMYLGARTQRFVPAIWLKVVLGGLLLYVAGRYLLGYFAA